MKNLLLTPLMVVMTLGVVSAQQTTTVESYIEVDGSYTKYVEPDIFALRITIDESTTKGKFSVADVEREMISKLKSKGIDTQKALKIDDISSTAARRNDTRTMATYTLSLNSQSQMVDVISTLSTLEIRNITLSDISNSDIDSHTSEARRGAMLDARTKATELSEAIGREAGECFQIFDRTNFAQPIMMRAPYAPTEAVNFQPIKVSYTVTARFYLLDGK